MPKVAAARSLLLDDLLFDFPFVETSDRAHMMALLLLPFARRLVGGVTPLHMVEVPASGSGKGLLVALVGVLATGEPASGGSIPDSDEELRKKISSELAGGQPLLVLDNADENKRLDSADLAAALTLPVSTGPGCVRASSTRPSLTGPCSIEPHSCMRP
jgi:hypothetical protein